MSRVPSAPLLLTGSHRSGSTWTGDILGAARDVVGVREPFNPVYGLHTLFERWFTYIDQDYAWIYETVLADIVHWRGLRHWRKFYTMRAMLPYYRACLRRSPAARLLFVDPIAAFSAEWLHRQFGFRVIILWRHPAAFVASLKRLDWRFDFNNWLDQPALMSDHLADLAPHFHAEHDLITEGAWVWRSIYQVLQTFQQCNPDFISVRHEDLATDPETAFPHLFEGLDLTFSRQASERLRQTTDAQHPVDGPPGSYNHLQRHSAELVDKWRRQLTPEEINRIHRITEPVAHLHYPADVW